MTLALCQYLSEIQVQILALRKLNGRFDMDVSISKIFTWCFMTVLPSLYLNVMRHSQISAERVQ